MRKEQSKETSGQLNSRDSLTRRSGACRQKKSSTKRGKQIGKRKERNSKKVKINSAAITQTSSEGHSLLSKQVLIL